MVDLLVVAGAFGISTVCGVEFSEALPVAVIGEVMNPSIELAGELSQGIWRVGCWREGCALACIVAAVVG